MSESDTTMSFIPTRGSLLKKGVDKNFAAVTYESYKSRKVKSTDTDKPNTKSKHTNDKSEKESDEFNVRKARHEVIKFGMSGFDAGKKEEAKIQLAIKLGAKPPKNKYKNYKELMQERKKEKSKSAAVQDFQQLGKNSIGKSIAKGKSFDRKRRKKDNILDIYGKVKKTQDSNK